MDFCQQHVDIQRCQHAALSDFCTILRVKSLILLNEATGFMSNTFLHKS